jgi:hypothetical protein
MARGLAIRAAWSDEPPDDLVEIVITVVIMDICALPPWVLAVETGSFLLDLPRNATDAIGLALPGDV